MLQTENMATDRTNQLKILVSDEEKAWLEMLATARGLTASDWVRLKIREEHEALVTKQRPDDEDDFRWKDWHSDIVTIVAGEKDPIDTDDISTEMHGGTFHYDGSWRGLPLALNQLRRNGYVRRLKTGYVITPKGQAAIKG